MKFSYTTLSELRAFGISDAEYPDNIARRLIRLYSDRFNRLTSQFFAPVETKFTSNGGHKLYKIPGPPILKVLQISLFDEEYGARTVISRDQYEVLDNTLIKFNTELRQGLANVEFNVVQGNMEGLKEVEVELTSNIASGTTEFTVVDASNLEPRDVLTFGREMFIIKNIDYVANKVFVDDPGDIKTITSGSKTICYGQVPMQVEEAIKLFVKNHKTLQAQKSGIKSEKIGNYSYVKDDTTSGITGISEIDSILFLFINDELDITFL